MDQTMKSRFVAVATSRAIDEIERQRLREDLIRGYQANAQMDREIPEEWRPQGEEPWDREIGPSGKWVIAGACAP